MKLKIKTLTLTLTLLIILTLLNTINKIPVVFDPSDRETYEESTTNYLEVPQLSSTNNWNPDGTGICTANQDQEDLYPKALRGNLTIIEFLYRV